LKRFRSRWDLKEIPDSNPLAARSEGMTQIYSRFHSATETCEDVNRLRRLHAEMDRAVLRAYDWNDLADRAEPIFLTEETEHDHTYRGRLFWPSDFRDEVLARLLALNADRHANEVDLGLGFDGSPHVNGDEDEDEDEVE
jgi:hypothetical protein